ncbi:unnamed protein product [Calicophoron daubneyi]|uniref:Uncharacterized protein n=1 Tax=Calicophoron daubneyi TaxID=300641 RepID=A0AAV2TV31_CALDB
MSASNNITGQVKQLDDVDAAYVVEGVSEQRIKDAFTLSSTAKFTLAQGFGLKLSTQDIFSFLCSTRNLEAYWFVFIL